MTTTDQAKSELHGLRIRAAQDKAITWRATDAIGALTVLSEPEGRPGHHEAQRSILRRTLSELDEAVAAKGA